MLDSVWLWRFVQVPQQWSPAVSTDLACSFVVSNCEVKGQRRGQWWKKVVTQKVFFWILISRHRSQAVWLISWPWLFVMVEGRKRGKVKDVTKIISRGDGGNVSQEIIVAKHGQLFGRSTGSGRKTMRQQQAE